MTGDHLMSHHEHTHTQDHTHHHGSYYLPNPSAWPLIGSIGLFILLFGAANWLQVKWVGPYLLFAGIGIVILMMVGWFGTVIRENQKGYYDKQVDRTYRWAMSWFIFSEICFFAVFFGALFYTRYWSVPILGGQYESTTTHFLLWPNFISSWPLLTNPNNAAFRGALHPMEAWGLPAMNTLILLTSGATITWAHWALKKAFRKQLVVAMLLTILLGVAFLISQGFEYFEAYEHFSLTLNAGVYGATFFLLTGFHGAHVTIGTIMLMVILGRILKGHFTKENHFAFEGIAWYWHFVDVVWLFLFVFVYWI